MIITNHDMAKFAELSTAEPGPIFIGPLDRSVYGNFLRIGYVKMREGTYRMTLAGRAAAQQWKASPALFMRDDLLPG